MHIPPGRSMKAVIIPINKTKTNTSCKFIIDNRRFLGRVETWKINCLLYHPHEIEKKVLARVVGPRKAFDKLGRKIAIKTA